MRSVDFVQSLNDGTPEVRDDAFAALAGIVKMVGMHPLERSLGKLDEVSKKKLTEMIGSGGNGTVVTGPTQAGLSSTSISKMEAAKKAAGHVNATLEKMMESSTVQFNEDKEQRKRRRGKE